MLVAVLIHHQVTMGLLALVMVMLAVVHITQAVTALLIRILVIAEDTTTLSVATSVAVGAVPQSRKGRGLGLLTGDGAMIFGEGILALDHLSAAVVLSQRVKTKARMKH
jgi:hypothetical protein